MTKLHSTKLDKSAYLTLKEQNSPVVDVQFLSAIQATVVLFQNGTVEFFRDYNYPAHNKLAELESSLTDISKIFQIYPQQHFIRSAPSFRDGIVFLKKDGSSVSLVSDPSTLTGKVKKIAKLRSLEENNIIWSDTETIVTKHKQQIYLYRLETSGYQQISQLTDVKSYTSNPYLKTNNNSNSYIVASYDQTKDLSFAYNEYGELKREFIIFPKNISKNLTQNILLNHDNMILETNQSDYLIYYRGQDLTKEPSRKESIKEIFQASRSTLIQYQDHSFQIISRNFESEVYKFRNPVIDVHVIPEVGFLLQLSNREIVFLKAIINHEHPEVRTFEKSLIQLPKDLQTIHLANDNALVQFSDQKLHWLFKENDLSFDFEPQHGNVTILDYLNAQIDFIIEVNSL